MAEKAAALTAIRKVPHWIDGQPYESDSDRYGEVFDSATGEQCADVVMASVADVDAAIQSAHDAFASWSRTPVLRRARVMFRFKELIERDRKEIAALVTQEHGKVLHDADGSIQRGLEVVEFACGIPHLIKGEYSDQVGTGVDTYSMRQPMGVCAGITPFNFPAMVPLWMFPLAIACGNTFVLKPSEKDPSCSMKWAELMTEAGLPDGVFNVVQGDHVAVNSILADSRVAAVSFVGSTPVAEHVYRTATEHGKRVQALGGFVRQPHLFLGDLLPRLPLAGRGEPVEFPELPTVPRYSPATPLWPTAFVVSEPFFMWPYQMIEPSAWTLAEWRRR